MPDERLTGDCRHQPQGLKPKRLAADTAYGTGKFLGWLIGAGITPHIPVWDKSTREDGTLSRSDFRWDKRRGVYICPNNKVLHTSGTVHDGRTLLYRASKLDCDVCELKARCCPKQLARKIPRDVHEEARDVARRLMGTKAFLKSRDERKRVEMRFAHLKIYHGFEQATSSERRTSANNGPAARGAAGNTRPTSTDRGHGRSHRRPDGPSNDGSASADCNDERSHPIPGSTSSRWGC